MSAQVHMLGRRLHLNHGPIDLIIEAFGDPAEVRLAYAQAAAAFPDVLPTLVQELATLRAPLKNISSPPIPMGGEGRVRGVVTTAPSQPDPHPPNASRWAPPSPADAVEGLQSGASVIGPVARRMVAACSPFAATFITPMAAVAGAVADHILEAMLAGRDLERAYVNDGGDIAFHLTPGHRLTCGVVADLAAPAIDGTIELTHGLPGRGIATSGRATKGQGGRSFSFGIADAVTVLAQDAASADAAATMIANAVDLPGHPAIRRGPASEIDPDSDLGERAVTLDLGELSPAEIRTALEAGVVRAEDFRRSGLIHGAVLVLKRSFATVGAGMRRLAAA